MRTIDEILKDLQTNLAEMKVAKNAYVAKLFENLTGNANYVDLERAKITFDAWGYERYALTAELEMVKIAEQLASENMWRESTKAVHDQNRLSCESTIKMLEVLEQIKQWLNNMERKNESHN